MKSENSKNYTIEKNYKFMPLGYQVNIIFKEKQILNNKLSDFWFSLIKNFLDVEISNFKELKNRKGIISDKIFTFNYPKEYKAKANEILFFKGRKDDKELTLNLKSSFLKSEKPNNYFFKIEEEFIRKASFYDDSKNLKENLILSELIPEIFRLSFLFFKPGKFGSIFGPIIGEAFCLEFYQNKLKVNITKNGVLNKNEIELNQFYLFSKVDEIYKNFTNQN